jgi:hypothetical protein
MRSKFSRHLRSNVVGYIALFIALGGTAYAGATITGSDVVDGSLTTADYRNNDIRTGDVRAETLTGADVADQSGVDTCVSTVRLGSLCVRAENFARPFLEALDHCANLDLRMPSLGEAKQLAQTHDIPNVDQSEFFWTDERFMTSGELEQAAQTVNDSGGVSFAHTSGDTAETVCVMTPTN